MFIEIFWLISLALLFLVLIVVCYALWHSKNKYAKKYLIEYQAHHDFHIELANNQAQQIVTQLREILDEFSGLGEIFIGLHTSYKVIRYQRSSAQIKISTSLGRVEKYIMMWLRYDARSRQTIIESLRLGDKTEILEQDKRLESYQGWILAEVKLWFDSALTTESLPDDEIPGMSLESESGVINPR